ncbi:MAG TPA: DEAD/DEAH box helicase [Syntrophales bacterium]|nr:DEAD/DEAH box helicase [Syntrophales bacterium]
MNIEKFRDFGIDDDFVRILSSWGIETFTHIQQVALRAGVADDKSMVVCAPTSSGKTLVGEIAILNSLRKGRKCIYLVSLKALADQKYDDFEKRFGEKSKEPLGTVGLSTGDRDEGEINPQLLVATYEKALGLLLSGQLDTREALVVADELQIIADPTRGPNIEALCAVLRQIGFGQFIALTATVGNPKDIAHWLNCKLAISDTRDIDLHQEVWFENSAHRLTYGQEAGKDISYKSGAPSDVLNAVDFLLSDNRGPVLVFTESRREAIEYAKEYSKKRARTTDGIVIAQQLDLFSEPTESSEQLKDNVERRVVFHTADLTQQERQVIEQCFIDSKFEVCFATSTLSAGVNFPFQTVMIPKLTYEWGNRGGKRVSRSDYRNMSGRAGRLGLHDKGYSILMPQNMHELRHANYLIMPENDNIISQIVNLSMRRTVLMLVSSGIVSQRNSLEEFFKNTLYWYQTAERNTQKLEDIIATAKESVDWLMNYNLIEQQEDVLLPTPLGKAVAKTGLLPSTAINFTELLRKYSKSMDENFDEYITGILHWACSCDEFTSRNPSRLLVWPAERRPVRSSDFLRSSKLLHVLDRTNNQVNQCAHALALYTQGVNERQIRFQTNIPSGGVHRLAIDISWIIDGLHRIVCVPDLECTQALANKFSMLARRVRWGCPAEVLDILRISQFHGVPGFGRQRAMALFAQGLTTFEEILGASRDTLIPILRNEDRTKSLLTAISRSIGFYNDRHSKVHQRVADELGLGKILKRCTDKLGVEYEDAIKDMMEAESRWTISVIDDGKRQNVPDLLIRMGDLALLIECKTTTKNPPLIGKEEAFAILQKAADFQKDIKRVTLGKPTFDETSKIKAQGALDITLIEHSTFIEGLLRVLAGVTDPREFLEWLATPGIAEIARLDGQSTYEISTTKKISR